MGDWWNGGPANKARKVYAEEPREDWKREVGYRLRNQQKRADELLRGRVVGLVEPESACVRCVKGDAMVYGRDHRPRLSRINQRPYMTILRVYVYV